MGKNAEFSHDEPIANSSMFVLPMMTAPAASSLRTTVAEYGGTKFARIFDPPVVLTPSVQNRSLTATGTPASMPQCFAARQSRVDFGGALERALRA